MIDPIIAEPCRHDMSWSTQPARQPSPARIKTRLKAQVLRLSFQFVGFTLRHPRHFLGRAIDHRSCFVLQNI